MNLLAHAIKLASTAHEHQLDKSGLPYILHPLRVMMWVIEAGFFSEATQIAAVLHDVVEDTDRTLDDIEREFGSTVAQAVDALTRRYDLELNEPLETYKEYIVRCCENQIGRWVKEFDIRDNMDPRRYHKDVPYQRYLWTLEYLQELRSIDRARAEHGVIS